MLLTCDLGEGLDDVDSQIIPLIQLASIACGGHAGNLQTAQHCIGLALANHARIGAHPSYPDTTHFGRLSMPLSAEQLQVTLAQQLRFLQQACIAQGTSVAYVKPHGALYNDMMQRAEVYQSIVRAVAEFKQEYGLAHCELLIQAVPSREAFTAYAEQWGIHLLFEAFADRRYLENGLLSPRKHAGAVLDNPADIVEQVENIVSGFVITATGTRLPLNNAHCICLHSDNPSSLEAARRLQALSLTN